MSDEIVIKQRILKAAESLFSTYGYSKVSMDELAAQLGMSKKTLYKYFPGKEHLLAQWVETFFAELGQGVSAIRQDRNLAFAAKLARFMALVSQRIAIVKEPFLQDIRRSAPLVWGQLETLRRATIQDQFRGIVEEGVRAGAIRADLDPQLITLVVLAAVDDLARPEILLQYETSFPEIFKTVIRVVLEGILTENARPLRSPL